MVNIVSINVNGLRDLSKFQNLCAYCTENYFDIVGVQETFWNDELVSDLSKYWEGKIFYSCTDTQRQGVAFLINKKFENQVKYIQSFDGRCVHIQLQQDGHITDIVNCYAPNSIKERVNFFNLLNEKMSNIENPILLGDMNTSMSILDRCKTKHTEDKAFKTLNQLCEDFNIYDIWRARNPKSSVFSWRRVVQNSLIQSRIDFIFVPKTYSAFVKNVYYKHNAFSDHSCVNINIDFSQVERGHGMWIFNNTLLHDESFVNKMTTLIEKEKQCRLYDSEPLIWFDNLKYSIKKLAQTISNNKSRAEKSEYFKIQREFERISAAVANNENVDLNKFEEVKIKLKTYEDKICKGAILRSKAQWALESDKNTSYFLQLEKYKQNRNSIKELKTKEGNLVKNTDEILNEIHTFYKELYSCTDIDKEKAEEILHFITERVPETDFDMLEADITPEEIKTALFSMALNKSPGNCGLTVSFYRHFYHLFEEIFIKIFKTIQDEQILTRSMRHGVITLIYKDKGEKNLLKNFRPISLLCVDYKILARIMSNRLKLVLPKLVSKFQTCCVPGRDIADTTSSVRDLIEIIEHDDLESYLIKVDEEKAFDRVDHDYLFMVLQKFGFGPKFIQWIQIFYKNVHSTVKCNGFFTKHVPIKNSIKQGCPVSALLYVLAAEPLGQAIMKNDKINGVRISNTDTEAKIFQHADDTNIFARTKESIHEAFNTLDLYSQASGAKINKQKSEIMCLGSGTLTDAEIDQLQIQRCENVTKVLGIYVGKDRKLCENLNWKDKIKRIKTILFFWNKRNLTLHGRAVVISSLLMSRLYYTLTVCPLPEYIKNEIRLIVMRFLWQGKSHLVKYQSIIGEKIVGGLNIPDIFLKMQAFRLKFLKRFLDSDCSAIWKSTFEYFIAKIDDMKLNKNIVYTMLNKKQLNQLPLYYQEMLNAFYKIKSKVDFNIDVEHVYDNPLFCNPNITHNGKMLLFEDFIQAGLIQIKDICYEFIPGFFTCNAITEIIQNKFPNTNTRNIIESYQRIINCIPEEWKNLLKHINPIHCDFTPQLFLNLGIDKSISFVGGVSKTFYKVLLSYLFEIPTCEKRWAEQFPSINLNGIYSVANLNFLPPDTRDLNYKVTHRAIFTMEKLFKINQVESDLCKNCALGSENLSHIFVFCPKLKTMHDYLKDIIDNVLIQASSDTVNEIDYEQLILFGYLKSSKVFNTYFLNFILSVARLSIYKGRNIKIQHNKDVNVLRLFKYTVQKYIEYAFFYYKSKQQDRLFHKYFLHNNPILLCENNGVKLLL